MKSARRRPQRALPFLPVAKRPVTLAVADQLRLQIAQGDLAPGQRLPSVPALALAFRVSQPTVHAAITALTFAGLVRTVHGTGTYVARADDEALLPIALRRASDAQLHALRLDLELTAARKAAERRTDRDLQRLWFAVSELRLAVAGRYAEAIAEADVDVHRELLRAAHDPLLTSVHRALGGRIERDLAGRVGHALRDHELVGAHQAIADALERPRVERVTAAVADALAMEGAAPE